MENGIIYRATSPSNKCYIGQTTRGLEERKKEHGREARRGEFSVFGCCLRKYSEERIEWEILEEIKIRNKNDGELLNELEIRYIELCDCIVPKGYNVSIGGGDTKGNKSNTGRKLSEEQKEKMSISAKRRWSREGERERMSETMSGRKKSEEHRKRLSEANKKRWEKRRREEQQV